MKTVKELRTTRYEKRAESGKASPKHEKKAFRFDTQKVREPIYTMADSVRFDEARKAESEARKAKNKKAI